MLVRGLKKTDAQDCYSWGLGGKKSVHRKRKHKQNHQQMNDENFICAFFFFWCKLFKQFQDFGSVCIQILCIPLKTYMGQELKESKIGKKHP